jgi:DinB family protein
MPIVPDTKNWTWVLDEVCPECGFDTASFPREQVGSMTRAVAAQWREILTSGRDLRSRPDDATWSPLEYGCHVRDVFRRFDGRLASMLETDDPLFDNWDQDVTAVEERYAEQDPQVVADELIAAGETIASRFDSVSGAQWSRRGRRSDGSAFTVESLGRYFIHDPVHHVWDVTSR